MIRRFRAFASTSSPVLVRRRIDANSPRASREDISDSGTLSHKSDVCIPTSPFCPATEQPGENREGVSKCHEQMGAGTQRRYSLLLTSRTNGPLRAPLGKWA